MKKPLLLIMMLVFVSLASAQENNSRLNVRYLKLIDNDTEASRARKTDGNGDKCALIKIQTPNMGEADRNRLEFKADMGTFTYKEKAVGEVKLFLTEGCKTLIILHPEYGKLIYPMPISVQGFKTYEMVLEAKKDGSGPVVVISSNYVLVKATPSDALISIDGNFYPDGSAYISVDEPHDLVVSRSLYHDYEKTIYASSKETMTYEVNLAPAFGWLLIDSSPESGATVLINGVRKGTTPYRSDTLASGEYEVTLMREMYENVTKTVRVVDGNESEISIPMKPNFANVTVTTDSESDIYIDGKLKDRATWTGRLLQGSHKVEARKTSHRTTAMALDVIAGKDESVKLDAPIPIYGAINVTSSPVEATVYLDGTEIGKTPLVNNKVLIGSHELRFAKQGCAPLVKTVVVEEGKMTNVNEKLDSGKVISITTGRNGDDIYIDDVLIGKSPLETAMGYGTHKVKAVRDGRKVEKEINVQIDGGPTSLTLEFGKIIRITTDRDGDVIYVDGKPAGSSPLDIDLTFGNHDIKSVRDKKSDEKRINVQREGASTVSLYLRAETPANWVRNGVNFMLLNGAFSTAPQTSFGLTIGQVKQWGWYASVMTNFNFSKADLTCDENGLIEGEDAPLAYSFKEKVTSRWSVTAGGLCKLGCPLYLYAGVGYGKRTLLWKLDDGRLAEPPGGAYKGVSFDAGLMTHIKGFSLSAGVTTIGTGYMEFKVGIGFCIRSRK
ncbi:MAG: PEGA domain-containing protein [Bacteroidia bacterium]|nr:PEGA domain-containing protein [Bacteroidia bacterium]